MSYNEELATRVRGSLAHLRKVEEKKMFRGVTFMVNSKMCVSVGPDEIMCRIDPSLHEKAIKRGGCRPVVMKGREYKGFVYVNGDSLKTKREFDYWINLALDFNKRARASKRKKTLER